MKCEFPKNFYWGAATSAHQVEGNNNNDWTEWEIGNAKIKMQNAKLRDWTNYILNNYPNPLQEKNYISGRACDHYHRFKEDFDIAKSLGHSAHRLSIEWSRIEPEEGKFNEKEIAHYQEVIDALRERGIEPFVTLWHWTLPVWFSKIGGFESKDAPKYFERYAGKIARSCNFVKFWTILNEPEIYSGNSYLKGVWPPQKRNIFAHLKVLRNLIRIHRKAYEVIKKIQPEARIGIAKNNIHFEAHKNNLIGGFLKKFVDWWWNFYFLNQIRDYQDFIGLNYYFHNRIKGFKFNQNENKAISDMGWEIYPKGIYHVLKDLKKYNKPIYITENGLADAKDEKRTKFIKDHLYWIFQAMEEGVDVRGYFHWSLLDNFEWDKGFWPRFGLVEIDYKTLERKIRPSAHFYKDICLKNSFDWRI